MKPTTRLYFTGSNLLQFTATVVDVLPSESGDRIILDQTAFYPTGGGQPHDIGRIGDARVIDVSEDEDGVIYHATENSGILIAGAKVEGEVESLRRCDHLQQHSGQHVLSQAFVQACGAATRSFHLGAETSTIDIELDSPDWPAMAAAEDLANAIVFEDRPMRVHLLSEEEASRLPLRKDTELRGVIRVIEIENFDWSPCGGTHASRTGQIGLIAIKSFERAKRMTRVEFVCGRRALLEFRRANRVGLAVAEQLSASPDQAPELVARNIQENKALKRRIRDLLELAVRSEAADLLAAVTADPGKGFKVVLRTFNDRDPDELRLLASKIVEAEPAIALLGSRGNESARLVFARSQSLTANMGQLLGEACVLLEGRGGGRPDLAQGGGPKTAMLDQALQHILSRLRSS